MHSPQLGRLIFLRLRKEHLAMCHSYWALQLDALGFFASPNGTESLNIGL